MKLLVLSLSKLLFLFKLFFKNLDFSATQLPHFDDFLTTIFIIITVYEPILSVCFLQLKQYFCMFYNDGNIFWQHILKP